MSFLDRFLPGMDPQEPASPPPFVELDRVIVQSEEVDAEFNNGLRGVVTDVEFITDPEDVYYPWLVSVQVDGWAKPLAFGADELLHDPVDDPDQPVPFVPTQGCSLVGPETEQLPPVTRHDDEVSAEARQVERMFADATEKSLREWTAQQEDAS